MSSEDITYNICCNHNICSCQLFDRFLDDYSWCSKQGDIGVKGLPGISRPNVLQVLPSITYDPVANATYYF
jgi:hypothetical protein